MKRHRDYRPSGVIPATLMAFHDDFSIDEPATRAHLRDVAATRGLSAITVNGHASEVHACSFAEQQRALAFSLDEIGDRLPLISGVYADGSLEAARLARMAEAEGASALLVFPPQSMAMGGRLRPEMAHAHFGTIADATDLPLIVFQYPAATGLGYPFDTLRSLLEALPSIAAVKGLVQRSGAARAADASLPVLAPPGDVAHHAFGVAHGVADDGGGGLVVGRGQRHRAVAGRLVRGGSGEGPGARASGSTTGCSR